jgi:hypothetical protein
MSKKKRGKKFIFTMLVKKEKKEKEKGKVSSVGSHLVAGNGTGLSRVPSRCPGPLPSSSSPLYCRE